MVDWPWKFLNLVGYSAETNSFDAHQNSLTMNSKTSPTKIQRAVRSSDAFGMHSLE